MISANPWRALKRMLKSSLVLSLSLASSVALAVDEDPCPPLIPKQDIIKLMQNTDKMTPEEQVKAMNSIDSSREIKKKTVWSGCHTVTDEINISAPVIIEPGAILKFEENAGLTINADGSLNASGTEDKPILFTATDETTGYWYGLYFSSNSKHNRLIHTKILYAGGDQVGNDGGIIHRQSGDNRPLSRAILVKGGGSLRIENSHIAYSSGYGMEILGNLNGFKQNTIDNSIIPMYIQPDTINMIDVNSKFSGNKHDEIQVAELGQLTRDAIWVDPGVPYTMRYGLEVSANLKLLPGVTILAGNESTLSINNEGSLNAIGSKDKPITIRGMSQAPGYWQGIYLNSRSADNDFKYIRVADGGGGDGTNGLGDSNIYVAGRLKIAHSWIENSQRVGILGDKNSGIDGQIELEDVIYKNNKVNYKEAE